MNFVILTGLSGAGKTRAMHALEDIGFFCVDNLPPSLIPVFYGLTDSSDELEIKRVAVVTDIRGGELFNSLFAALDRLEKEKKGYKILFLDAEDSVIVNRFQETRRRHPLADKFNGSLSKAVMIERGMLDRARTAADYVIDTSNISPAQLKNQVVQLFLEDGRKSLNVHCMSFGFKNGIPKEADLVFDVRFIENPFYVAGLRNLTGLDRDVYDFVMEKEEAQGFIKYMTEMINFLLPLYGREGKSQLVVAIGCTGGNHRSVAIAQYLYEYLKKKDIRVSVTHRDITKRQ